MSKEIWIAGCRPDTEASTPGRTVLVCNPRLIRGNVTLGAERPVKAIVENGRVFYEDDGAMSSEVMRKLSDHLRRYG